MTQLAKSTKITKVTKVTIYDDHLATLAEDSARDLYSQSRFGEMSEGRVILTFVEALYLLEKRRVIVVSKRKEYTFDQLFRHAQKKEKNLWTKYLVYKDLRKRGYIVKTGLKFGAEFRVYDRGVKPGDNHARWIVHPVAENHTLRWHEFASTNRVAHSTKKNLLIAIVDDESKVTYYEVQWLKP